MKRREFPAALADSATLRTPKRDAYSRRDGLLDAAEERFAAEGVTQASLQAIGAAVGLAPYAVRAQYGNRDIVLEGVIDRHLDRLIDRIRTYQALGEATDPAARLGEAIGHLLDMLWAYRAGQRVHVAAVAGASPALARSLKLRQRHLVYFYAGLIAAAVPEAQELAMPAALSLMGMASWHVLWFRERGALGRAEYAAMVANMVIEGVRASVRQ
ncbi:MAG: hypothetical protein ABI369_00470, partial [Acetobacteraceae bacterium]